MAAKKSSIDTKLIRELADLLNETDLHEIEVEEDDLRIRISRGGGGMAMPIQSYAAPVPVAPAAAAEASTLAASSSAGESAAEPSGDGVPSPMVGTAYHSPSPGSPPFVSVGKSVRKGETVMIVEAMKTMNQIPAPRDGVIASIDVEDGQPVEYGQTLVTIE